MKLRNLLCALAVVALWTTIAFGQTHAGVLTSKHNIGTNACQTCHEPHGTSFQKALWRLAVPSTAFTKYGTATPMTAPTTGTEANFHTYMCLSCHDGVQAAVSKTTLTTLYGTFDWPSAIAPTQITNGVATDLQNDHPVDFTFAADASHNDPATLTIAKAFTGTVQCASCHDPHIATATAANFLRGTTSTLCTDCHK